MRRYESKDPAHPGYVEVPDVWLLGHLSTYRAGYWGLAAQRLAAKEPPASVLECQVAGALALILVGDVKAELPGLVMADGQADISGLPAESAAALMNAVILPLEETQSIPFGWSSPSPNGSTAAPSSVKTTQRSSHRPNRRR